jgi:hypothetical protein
MTYVNSKKNEIIDLPQSFKDAAKKATDEWAEETGKKANRDGRKTTSRLSCSVTMPNWNSSASPHNAERSHYNLPSVWIPRIHRRAGNDCVARHATAKSPR